MVFGEFRRILEGFRGFWMVLGGFDVFGRFWRLSESFGGFLEGF